MQLQQSEVGKSLETVCCEMQHERTSGGSTPTKGARFPTGAQVRDHSGYQTTEPLLPARTGWSHFQRQTTLKRCPRLQVKPTAHFSATTHFDEAFLCDSNNGGSCVDSILPEHCSNCNIAQKAGSGQKFLNFPDL